MKDNYTYTIPAGISVIPQKKTPIIVRDVLGRYIGQYNGYYDSKRHLFSLYPARFYGIYMPVMKMSANLIKREEIHRKS